MDRHGLSIRGDSLYCPLSFQLDPYLDCSNDCWHCYLRRLNYIWKGSFSPADPETLRRKLTNGLKNKNPQSALAWAIAQRKAIRFGNKADPFQKIEEEEKSARGCLEVLRDLRWEFVIQTMETERMMSCKDLILECKEFCWIQPIISPGAEKDWEVLERKRTTPIKDRFKHLIQLKKYGVKVAVNGEPFIPGFHTVEQFEDMLKRLKAAGVNRYNTYNFHFNDFVAKRLRDIGLDIMAIWEGNQDKAWKPVQQKLLELARKYDIILGCPDFVNTGWDDKQQANTCCGIDVENPTFYNTHFFKHNLQAGMSKAEVLKMCWDHIGDKKTGEDIVYGKKLDNMYTMADAMEENEKEGLGIL